MFISNSYIKRQYLFISLLALAIFLFCFFRLYDIEKKFDFTHDQEQAALASYRIIIEKKPILIGQETSTGGLFVGPLLYYLQSLSMIISRFDPIGLFYSGFIASLATLILLFLTIERISDKWTALIGSFLYALSERIILYDLTGNAITYISLISSAIVYFIIRIFIEKTYKFLPLLFLLLSLSLHVHLTLTMFFPPVAYLTITNFKYFSKKTILFSLLLFLIPLTPFLLFEIRHSFLITHNLMNFSNQSQGAQISLVKPFLIQIPILSEATFFRTNNTYVSFAIVIIIAAIFLKTKTPKQLKYLLLTLIFSPSLLLIFYKYHIPEYYLYATVAPFIVISAIAYLYLAKLTPLLPIFILIIIAIKTYSLIIPNNGYYFSLQTKKLIVQKILETSDGNSFNLYSQIPASRNNGFKYLFKWMQKEPTEGGKHLFVMGFAKENNFYPNEILANFKGKEINEFQFDPVTLISIKNVN